MVEKLRPSAYALRSTGNSGTDNQGNFSLSSFLAAFLQEINSYFQNHLCKERRNLGDIYFLLNVVSSTVTNSHAVKLYLVIEKVYRRNVLLALVWIYACCQHKKSEPHVVGKNIC